MVAFAAYAMAQSRVITGQVSSDDGTLPGATIREEGTNNGTITDADGNFSLDLQSEDAVIIISYVGFATQKNPLQGAKYLECLLGGG